MDAAGGPIARKRLEAELRGAARAPEAAVGGEWTAARACALVADALALHARLGTVPPPEFARWRRLLRGEPPRRRRPDPASPGGQPPIAGPRSSAPPTLLDLPELMGWFIDPARVQQRGPRAAPGAREPARRLRPDQGRARGGHRGRRRSRRSFPTRRAGAGRRGCARWREIFRDDRTPRAGGDGRAGRGGARRRRAAGDRHPVRAGARRARHRDGRRGRAGPHAPRRRQPRAGAAARAHDSRAAGRPRHGRDRAHRRAP